MEYPKEYRESILRRIQLGEITVLQAHRQYGTACSAIYRWLRLLNQDSIGTSINKTKEASLKNITLPKGITYLQAYGAVTAKLLLGEVEFGKYCRQKGITTDQVANWEKWFKAHPNAVSAELYDQSQKSLRYQKEQCQRLEKKAAKSDKALARTAEMLLLSKKAQAILAEEENQSVPRYAKE